MENNNRIIDDCFLLEKLSKLSPFPKTLYLSSDASVLDILAYKQRWEDLADTYGCKLNVEINSSSSFVDRLFENHPAITVERRESIE